MNPSDIEASHRLDRRFYALERVVGALAAREGASKETLAAWRRAVSEGELYQAELLDIGNTLDRDIRRRHKP